MDWQGYYLVRSYKADDPFASITDLPPEDAVTLCEKILPWRGTATGGKYVIRDQVAYLKTRLNTEKWLHENAGRAGVHIDKANPAYFGLTREPDRIINLAEAGTKFVILRASEVNLSRWSFTVNDSFSNRSFARDGQMVYGESPHPSHGTVMNAEQIAAAIDRHGNRNSDGSELYIEAQMWAQRPTLLSQLTSDAPARPPPAVKPGQRPPAVTRT